MARKTHGIGKLLVLGLMVLALAGAGVGASRWAGARPRARRLPAGVPTAVVRRADVKITVRAAGQVESSKQTKIECDLENLQFRSHGRSLNAGGSSYIIWLIAEGSMVKEGDVLCELDASDYEELVRQETIKVDEERSDRIAAELNLEVAEVALREYEEGTSRQIIKDFEGRIALSESDIQHGRDRLAWTRRMLEKGYVPLAQLAAEEVNLQRAELTLLRTKGEYENYIRFGLPKMLKLLRSDIEAYRAILTAQVQRLESHQEQLAYFQRQVDACTIRAPHDGFVIYARERETDPPIDVGSWVRQKQDLFYLPDLAQMEILTPLHETIVDRVRNGMSAKVRVEALPQAVMEGHVVAINKVPSISTSWRTSSEVKYYLSRVQLDTVPRGLKPGMSAEVELVTGSRAGALVVPATAVTTVEGREVCYVAGEDGLQRREVVSRPATHDLIEIDAGLEEGEEVVLDPLRLDEETAKSLADADDGTGLLSAPPVATAVP